MARAQKRQVEAEVEEEEEESEEESEESEESGEQESEEEEQESEDDDEQGAEGDRERELSEEELAPVDEDDDVDAAIDEYLAASRRRYERQQEKAKRQEAIKEAALQPSPATSDDDDSSDDERNVNTIGNVPLEWYNEEDHIGYTVEGQKMARPERADALERLIKRSDPKAWRTIYDEYNGEEITLTKEEIKMISRLRRGRFPHREMEKEAYPDFPEYVTLDGQEHRHPFSQATEPKRRFLPSKWEAKKVIKLVRALRRGWIKIQPKEEEQQESKAPNVYLMWNDNEEDETTRTAVGLPYVPAPKSRLPGHKESFNPPEEYLPTEEEMAAWGINEEERPSFVPKKYNAMRLIPMYEDFVKDRFERCLDLYLCPRTRRKRLNIDPEDLKPKLPKPRDLQPFPATLGVVFEGHSGPVRCLDVHKSGQWLATGGEDGTVRLWEVATGRCARKWTMEAPIKAMAWCRAANSYLLAVATGYSLVILEASAGFLGKEGGDNVAEKMAELLEDVLEAAVENGSAETEENRKLDGEGDEEISTAAAGKKLVKWSRWAGAGDKGVVLTHKFQVRDVCWHSRGDYFSTVCPDGNTASVLVHQLSRAATQCPFRKLKGRVRRTLFHPVKPIFFVATRYHIRVYNLQRQALVKKLTPTMNGITSIDVHPGGDNILVCAEDTRSAWIDMDLSTKPYKMLRHHSACVQAVTYHRSFPLFATASDDGTVHVFHGMVYADLLQNALIVPLKILRGHKKVDAEGVLDIAFHPRQPWIFTAGADSTVRLYYN